MSENAIALWAAILVFFAGAMLVRASLWPRRRGSELHCPTCGYALTGNVSGVCPECGTNLADKSPRRGVRRRRPILAALGIVATLVGIVGTVAAATPFYRQIDWYRFKPTSWVVRDLEAAVPSDAQRAWTELTRRRANGDLSDKHEQAIIAACLREHAKFTAGPLGVSMVEHLGQLERDWKLTDAQRNQFFAQAVQTKWKVRPLVLVGQDVPYAYDGSRRLPSGDWYVRTTRDGFDHIEMSGGQPDGLHFGGSATLYKSPGKPTTTPGVVTVVISQRVFIYRGNGIDPKNLAWEGDMPPVRLTTEVLAAPTTQYLKPINKPELRAALEKSIRVSEFGYVRPDYFDFTVEAKNPPIGVAFECFARVDGKEIPLGTVTFKAGARSSYGMGAYQLEPLKPKRADIILRSSAKAAGATVELFDYWDGELVFEDVPVKNPK